MHVEDEAARRLLRVGALYAASALRVGSAMLFTVHWNSVPLLCIIIIVTRRSVHRAGLEVASGLGLGICFHPRAALVVGTAVLVFASVLTHFDRPEPEPIVEPEALPPSHDAVDEAAPVIVI